MCACPFSLSLPLLLPLLLSLLMSLVLSLLRLFPLRGGIGAARAFCGGCGTAAQGEGTPSRWKENSPLFFAYPSGLISQQVRYIKQRQKQLVATQEEWKRDMRQLLKAGAIEQTPSGGAAAAAAAAGGEGGLGAVMENVAAVRLNEDALQVSSMAKWLKRGEARLRHFGDSLGAELHRSHSDSDISVASSASSLSSEPHRRHRRHSRLPPRLSSALRGIEEELSEIVGYIRTLGYVRGIAGPGGRAGQPALGFGAVPLQYSQPQLYANSGYAGGLGAGRFGVGRAALSASGANAAAASLLRQPALSLAGRKWTDYLALASAAPQHSNLPSAHAARSAAQASSTHEAWLRSFTQHAGDGGAAVAAAGGGVGYEVGASAPGAPGSQEAIAGADFVIYITANKSGVGAKPVSPAR
ncbi:hypothetical protein T492DRAFT_834538 [Pavlovales sp. CCMP2436]|nr:hypothetical protein T492DRAFT_834538 [Pavlovales sp. CCMP2436]